MRYNNYHKHTHVSNIYFVDSNAKARDYCERAKELGHTTYFTTEHGTFGDIFEAKTLCSEYSLKCIAAVEAYIVPDNGPALKDKSNYHIVLIPKTNEGRRKLNYLLSMASIKGFYFRPRLSTKDLLTLDPDEVYITTACVSGILRDEASIEKIFLPIYNHFKSNLFLEIQNHNNPEQIEINKKALGFAKELGLKLIAANDSHYIDAAGQKERDELLKGKGHKYDDEDKFMMDYPDYETFVGRFIMQGVFSPKQIEEAIANTLIFDECEEIDLDHSIKMPTIYPALSPAERFEVLKKDVSVRFAKIAEEEDIKQPELDEYLDGINYEMKIVEDTNEDIHTADYFLLNEKLVSLAVNKYGGVLTRGGRGSCASFYINRILGMTQLDRFRIKLPIFPDRFASTARLLENRSLPDIDFNVKEQEPFIKAARELLGENGCYPMIAYQTMQLGEAFRNVCRSKNIPYEEYNDIAKNIEKHTEDKYWKPYIDEAQKYMGTIISSSVHPCFDGEELVRTSHGFRRIVDVQPGEEVLSSDGKYHEVLNTMRTPAQKIYKIKFMGRPPIKTTINHPFLIRHRERKNGRWVFSEPEWKRVCDIGKDDFAVMPVNQKSELYYSGNLKTDRPDFWWFVGRYVGDGWLKKKYPGRKGEFVVIVCSNKPKTFEIEERLDRLGCGYWVENARTADKIHIQSKELYKFMEYFGRGAHNKHLPEFVKNLPIDLLSSFIDGYMSADGHSVGNKGMLCTASRRLCYDLAECIAKVYKVPCCITVSDRRDESFEIEKGRFVQGAVLYAACFTYPRKRQRHYVLGNDLLVPWVSTEETDEVKDVYNLEVADTHDYTVSGMVVHNCAFVLSNKDILYEYGVVKIGDAFCVMVTSGEADEYKLLKNDFLIVSVWKLIDETFKAIGQPIIPARELLEKIKDDDKVWNLFRDGITCTLNQVDTNNGMQQAKQYGIHSFEDGAFIAAAIRPSFDSWREQFLKREPYTTGSKDLDKVLEMTHHYILFQENLMQYFDWLGVSPAESIGLIKKISKKKIKQEDFDNLEIKLKENWIKNTGSDEMFEETWHMIQSCISYGFAAPHAAAVSLDMCYGAYLKAHHPYEYYCVCLNNYADDLEKTRKLTAELKYFGINLEGISFRKSRREYSFDKTAHTIYKGMSAIKFMNTVVPEELYALRNNKYRGFIDLLSDIEKKTTANTKQIEILIQLNYFAEFGEINKLLKLFDLYKKLTGRSTIKKTEAEAYGIPDRLLKRYSASETNTRVEEMDYERYLKDKGYTDIEAELKDCRKVSIEKSPIKKKMAAVGNQYSFSRFVKKFAPTEAEMQEYAIKTVIGAYQKVDVLSVLREMETLIQVPPCSLQQKLSWQLKHFGYIETIMPDVDLRYVVVTELDTKYTPRFKGYCLATGQMCDFKIKRKPNPKDKTAYSCFSTEPVADGDLIYIAKCGKRPRQRKTADGYVPIPDEFDWWANRYRKVDSIQ